MFDEKLLLFICYSSIGTAVDIGLLNILVKLIKINKKKSNIISYTVGVIVAFFLCRAFVFTDAQDNIGGRLLVTIVTHSFGLVIQQWLLNALIKKGLGLNFAKFITIIENAIVMFFLTKYVVFWTF